MNKIQQMGHNGNARVVNAIFNGNKNNDDLIGRAQEIIDSYVLLEYRKKKTTGMLDVVLWILVAAAAALTLFLYIYIR